MLLALARIKEVIKCGPLSVPAASGAGVFYTHPHTSLERRRDGLMCASHAGSHHEPPSYCPTLSRHSGRKRGVGWYRHPHADKRGSRTRFSEQCRRLNTARAPHRCSAAPRGPTACSIPLRIAVLIPVFRLTSKGEKAGAGLDLRRRARAKPPASCS